MRNIQRRMAIATPIARLIVLLAFLAVWSWGQGGKSGDLDSQLRANVEYTVFDASGAIKEHRAWHNATTVNLLNDARTRLSTATTVTADGTYTGIALCNDNPNSALTNGGTATKCTLTTNLSTNNPINVVAASAGNGKYQVQQIFTASGAAGPIKEIQLVKNVTSDTQPAPPDIGAARGVNISLVASDTLQITWTVTIN